jgi:hypothetical protein
MTTAALVDRLSRLVPDDAASFHVYSGTVLEKWLQEREDPSTPSPSQPVHREPKHRRPSVKRTVEALEKLGKRVTGIEVMKDGTTRMLCGDEENNAPADYWDRKLR